MKVNVKNKCLFLCDCNGFCGFRPVNRGAQLFADVTNGNECCVVSERRRAIVFVADFDLFAQGHGQSFVFQCDCDQLALTVVINGGAQGFGDGTNRHHCSLGGIVKIRSSQKGFCCIVYRVVDTADFKNDSFLCGIIIVVIAAVIVVIAVVIIVVAAVAASFDGYIIFCGIIIACDCNGYACAAAAVQINSVRCITAFNSAAVNLDGAGAVSGGRCDGYIG